LDFRHWRSAPQLAGALHAQCSALTLFVSPLGLTLAEALSPHTWDQPAIFLVGGICAAILIASADPSSPEGRRLAQPGHGMQFSILR
jgi:hypothetical protein